MRPHLEYAVQFWSPTLEKDIKRLEAVQARATKLIPSIRQIGYQRRLERLNLFNLETRRLRGQLIETFKILNGITNIEYNKLFTLSRLIDWCGNCLASNSKGHWRRNKFRLNTHWFKINYRIKKNYSHWRQIKLRSIFASSTGALVFKIFSIYRFNIRISFKYAQLRMYNCVYKLIKNNST